MVINNSALIQYGRVGNTDFTTFPIAFTTEVSIVASLEGYGASHCGSIYDRSVTGFSLWRSIDWSWHYIAMGF